MKLLTLIVIVTSILFGSLIEHPVAFAAPVEEIPMSRVSDEPLMCMAQGVRVVHQTEISCPTQESDTIHEHEAPEDLALQSADHPDCTSFTSLIATKRNFASFFSPQMSLDHRPVLLSRIATVVLIV